MFIDTTHRRNDIEIMDDLDMSGELLIGALDKLTIINKWLGGNQLTLNGVRKLIKNLDKSKEITIVDLGCGGGDILRVLADYARHKNFNFKLIGIDANLTTIKYAQNLSTDYPNISYQQLDIDSSEFDELEYDIALSTLFLHHFEHDKVDQIIKQWSDRASIGVVVNDLHRHSLAYYLFYFITLFFGNEMVRNDGLLSILKGFKRKDLEQHASRLPYKSTIMWKWAFRYEWIIKK
jgi:2-polyprenyl-3-methyl-5-hydroxy-6-metoxy-1,4-benzoquinol methylase